MLCCVYLYGDRGFFVEKTLDDLKISRFVGVKVLGSWNPNIAPFVDVLKITKKKSCDKNNKNLNKKKYF